MPRTRNKRFEFIRANRQKYRIAKLCSVLGVSRGGYYAWDKRPDSNRTKKNKELLKKIKVVHEKSRKVYGSTKITRILNKDAVYKVDTEIQVRLVQLKNALHQANKTIKFIRHCINLSLYYNLLLWY